MAIWREYQEKEPTWKLSKTALVIKIASKHGVKSKSSAYDALNRGKKLSG